MNRIIRTMAIMAGSLGFFPLGVSAQSYSDVWNQKGLNARYHGNYSLAYQCFKMSAEYGDEKGQYNLGYCYLTGLGVLQDEARAFQWFEKAADKGNIEATYNMGYCFENGLGVGTDSGKAKEYYQRAAQRGYSPAQAGLKRLEGLPAAPADESSTAAPPPVAASADQPKASVKKGKKKRRNP